MVNINLSELDLPMLNGFHDLIMPRPAASLSLAWPTKNPLLCGRVRLGPEKWVGPKQEIQSSRRSIFAFAS